ncbi:MAG: hypothetical protein AVDCRST_MAG91-522, partial [uncultured Sphingomonadaceae bacterium]
GAPGVSPGREAARRHPCCDLHGVDPLPGLPRGDGARRGDHSLASDDVYGQRCPLGGIGVGSPPGVALRPSLGRCRSVDRVRPCPARCRRFRALPSVRVLPLGPAARFGADRCHLDRLSRAQSSCRLPGPV